MSILLILWTFQFQSMANITQVIWTLCLTVLTASALLEVILLKFTLLPSGSISVFIHPEYWTCKRRLKISLKINLKTKTKDNKILNFKGDLKENLVELPTKYLVLSALHYPYQSYHCYHTRYQTFQISKLFVYIREPSFVYKEWEKIERC